MAGGYADRYPGIRRACMLITVDNGGLHRGRSERKVLSDMERFLAQRAYGDEFGAIDRWLAALDDEALQIVCCGEEREMEAAIERAPPFTSALLNDYFEQVC